MEPVTHFLTGAAIGRAAFNRRTAYATLVCTLAAEAADLDVLWGFAGPVEQLKHHRGITHTFPGAPFVALAAVGFIWLLDRFWFAPRARRKHRPPPQKIHYGWLFLAALTAALSHILLDFTNSYGVRPFFPFSPRWYSADLVFIAEPLLWIAFFIAFTVPAILNLTDREILGRPIARYHGRLSATLALLFMAALWTLRFVEHAAAINRFNSTQVAAEPVLRAAVLPYPINPFRWHAICETEHGFQTAEVDLRTGSIVTDQEFNVIPKPAETPALKAARQSALGRVYLDWGRWAITRDLGPEPIPYLDPPPLSPPHKWTAIRFDDLRFMYDFRGSGLTAGPSALTGWVYIVDGAEEAGEVLGSRVQQ
jgi:inner membrane protein